MEYRDRVIDSRRAAHHVSVFDVVDLSRDTTAPRIFPFLRALARREKMVSFFPAETFDNRILQTIKYWCCDQDCLFPSGLGPIADQGHQHLCGWEKIFYFSKPCAATGYNVDRNKYDLAINS